MTTAPKNAKTAALEALIEAHAIELKLPTVRRRFRALAAEATREQQTPTAYLAALLASILGRARRRGVAWCWISGNGVSAGGQSALASTDSKWSF
jgi:hypothetical protein